MSFDDLGLLGIPASLALVIWLAYRGWSVLLVGPAAALPAAACAGEPLLASWTQTFMKVAFRWPTHCSARPMSRTG